MKLMNCMENNVFCLNPQNTIQDCAKIMSENHIGCVPVCDEKGCIVGLVTDRDIVLRSISTNKDVKTTPVSKIMTKNICTCNYNTDIKQAEELMSSNQIRRLPVVDDNNKIVGIITLGDLCKNNAVNNDEVSKTFNGICKNNNKNAQ